MVNIFEWYLGLQYALTLMLTEKFPEKKAEEIISLRDAIGALVLDKTNDLMLNMQKDMGIN